MAKSKRKLVVPDDCRECPNWPKVAEKVRIADVLKKTIERMEKEIAKDDFKTTLADYLKLVQLEKDLDDNTVKEIKVSWVKPEKTEGSSGEE